MAVAGSTLLVPAVNHLRVRQPMTVVAFGDEAMFSTVAIGAVDAGVVGLVGGELIGGLAMTGAAETAGDVTVRNNEQRLVGRMASLAIDILLFGQMGRMTFQATGCFCMPAVAAVAEELGMTAGGGAHLLPDFAMAGKAFLAHRLEGIAQIGYRLVRVGVAVQAVTNLVVGMIAVAVRTGDVNIRPRPLGRMLRVAVEAADLRVGAAGPGDFFQLKAMAFAAIVRLQFWPLDHGNAGAEKKEQEHRAQAADSAKKEHRFFAVENSRYAAAPLGDRAETVTEQQSPCHRRKSTTLALSWANGTI